MSNKLLKLFILILFPFFAFAQDAKLETIIAFGTGVDENIALTNAKLNALEQVFGTFITTTTVIENDSIVLNKIVSITNGQITNYEIVKSEKTDYGYIVTIKLDANISKLVNFCESIGIEANVKGSLFSVNLATKMNNRANEVYVIQNFINTFKSEIGSMFDYNISTDEPIKASNADKYLIRINCSVVINKNFNSIVNVLINLIDQVAIKQTELPDFKKSNLEFYPLIIVSENQICYRFLRSKESQKLILEFVKNIEQYLKNITLIRNDNKEMLPISRVGNNFNFLYYLINDNWNIYNFFNSSIQTLSIGKLAYKSDFGEEEYLTKLLITKYSIPECSVNITDSIFRTQAYIYENKTYIETPFFMINTNCLNNKFQKYQYVYNDWLTVEEMSKVERYTIKKD